MNKADFVASVAKKLPGLTKAQTADACNAILAAVSETLTSGENVPLPGFGIFKISERAARTARNPRTGKEIKIPAQKAVKFVAGKALKDSMK